MDLFNLHMHPTDVLHASWGVVHNIYAARVTLFIEWVYISTLYIIIGTLFLCCCSYVILR